MRKYYRFVKAAKHVCIHVLIHLCQIQITLDYPTHQKFEDTQGVIRSRKSKNGQFQKARGQTIIFKIHRKLKIEQDEPH